MAIISSLSNTHVLILDDLPEMRSSLRSQLVSLGCEKVSVSSNVKDALELCSANKFDLILCDFYLAGGTDGQQFLEFLRNRRIISRSAVFVMVTAEKGYENVVTAAECLPDDYLLKPFTADALKSRIERLVEKKKRLAKVDAMQDKGNWPEVIAACEEIIAARDRYLVDAMRIKGNALILSGRTDVAVEFYQQMIALRPMPWAQLGLARAQHQHGDAAAGKNTLQALIVESPKMMAAYDLLGRMHQESGDHDEALAVLDSACEISPNSLARHRAIASVAEETGDFSRVEQALNQVVKKTRNSPLRDTKDFARLGNALTEMGEPAKAVQLLEEARTSFKEDANNPLLAAVEAVAQQKAGRPELAAQALERAMQGGVSNLPQEIAMAVAKACLATGKQDEGESILKNLVQSAPDATGLHGKISAVLRDSGLAERADQLVAESMREIIQLNNEAVRRARAGELTEAAEMLVEAANRLPNNVQIVTNAAFALLFDVYTNGIDPTKIRLAQQFQQSAQAQNPKHPKLADIADLMGRIRSKYAAGKS
jgi:CheY-like chemotaxis protein/Tfp pilus assembly protein PilF